MAMVARMGAAALVRVGYRHFCFARRRSPGMDDPPGAGNDRVPVRADTRQAAAERPVNEEETMVRLLCANLAVVSLILIVTVATLYILVH